MPALFQEKQGEKKRHGTMQALGNFKSSGRVLATSIGYQQVGGNKVIDAYCATFRVFFSKTRLHGYNWPNMLAELHDRALLPESYAPRVGITILRCDLEKALGPSHDRGQPCTASRSKKRRTLPNPVGATSDPQRHRPVPVTKMPCWGYCGLRLLVPDGLHPLLIDALPGG